MFTEHPDVRLNTIAGCRYCLRSKDSKFSLSHSLPLGGPWLEEAWVVKSAVVATLPPAPHEYCLDGEVIAAATWWE